MVTHNMATAKVYIIFFIGLICFIGVPTPEGTNVYKQESVESISLSGWRLW